MRARALFLAGVLLPLSASAQEQDFSKVEIKVEKAGGNVYMLAGAGGNIAVSIGDDGAVVVDDEFAPLVPKIDAAIKGLTPKPVKFLINTHWHFDHTGGNAAMAKSTTIVAHDNVRKRMAEGAHMLGRTIEPAPKEALPVLTFDSSLTVHLNGEDIRALHFARGHTDGDSVIFFPKSNVVHMGDDFVTYGLPFVDVASGGSVVGMAENVEKVMATLPDDVKVIPGHGPLSAKPDALKFAAMLRDCIALVDKARKAGKTADQMKKENVLAKYAELGGEKAFVKTNDFIELIANELSGAKTEQKSTVHH
jgi:glyoxylase-like metal-dependent hydrolase (beta-lactamase superfamily II)